MALLRTRRLVAVHWDAAELHETPDPRWAPIYEVPAGYRAVVRDIHGVAWFGSSGGGQVSWGVLIGPDLYPFLITPELVAMTSYAHACDVVLNSGESLYVDHGGVSKCYWVVSGAEMPILPAGRGADQLEAPPGTKKI